VEPSFPVTIPPGLAALRQTLYEARSLERPLRKNELFPTLFRLIRGFHGRP
jgi:hypothetical protein